MQSTCCVEVCKNVVARQWAFSRFLGQTTQPPSKKSKTVQSYRLMASKNHGRRIDRFKLLRKKWLDNLTTIFFLQHASINLNTSNGIIDLASCRRRWRRLLRLCQPPMISWTSFCPRLKGKLLLWFTQAIKLLVSAHFTCEKLCLRRMHLRKSSRPFWQSFLY